MKKPRYKVVIQFNGSLYSGWQIQSGDTPTVQREFNKALKLIFKEEIKTAGSGRTDAGVHAREFHIVFTAPFVIEHHKLIRALNSNLAGDIKALASSFVDDKFRVTNDAVSKEYRYFFTTDEVGLPFSNHLMVHVRYSLDIELMKEACVSFVGTHDYKNFHCVGSNPHSTVRTITECELVYVPEDIMGLVPNYFYLRIKGNGFLKQMVRLIVGAIWDVGKKKISIKDINATLVSPDFHHIAAVAPASGLYKFNVEYS